MTRITWPAATHSMSSPGRILNSSAIALGTVTWYFDVTFAIPLLYQGWIPCSRRTTTSRPRFRLGELAAVKRADMATDKPPASPKPKAPGHGRHAAKAYRGAHKVHVAHHARSPKRMWLSLTNTKSSAGKFLAAKVIHSPLAQTVWATNLSRCVMPPLHFSIRASSATNGSE